MKYLVTGAAGFIGFHLSKRLLDDGHEVVGLDNLNDYYDPKLKYSRLNILQQHANFAFAKQDIADKHALLNLFDVHSFERVFHLAAQAGVRYSIDNPSAYVDSNLVGQANVLEACRHHQIKHLIYASSSSVYGLNQKQPFSASDGAAHPVSLYAATKKAGEMMAHSYSQLFDLPTTGLRFFTVYGPWGRPDMALFKFTSNILANKEIDVYNHGQLARDFTYIDDVVESMVRLSDHIPTKQLPPDIGNFTPDTSSAPYRILNIGNGNPSALGDFIGHIEQALGVNAMKNMLPMQPGDVHSTFADSKPLQTLINFAPSTSLKRGVTEFVEWYLNYYGHSSSSPCVG